MFHWFDVLHVPALLKEDGAIKIPPDSIFVTRTENWSRS
jgi:hypothetical protein